MKHRQLKGHAPVGGGHLIINLLAIMFVTVLLQLTAPAMAQSTTAWYQPTPYPSNVTTGIHIWDGWVTNIYYGRKFVQDDKLEYGGYGDTYRAFLRFDTSGLPTRVAKATLVLAPFPKNDGSTPTSATLFSVAGPWSPATTAWDSQPAATPVASLPAPVPGQPWRIDITSEFNAWQEGKANDGFRIDPLFINNNFSLFRSSRYAADSERPLLELEFTPPVPTPNFKMPLPSDAAWLVTTEPGGYDCTGVGLQPNPAHAGDRYYAIDFSWRNIDASGNPVYSKPSDGGEVPVLAAAAGRVVRVVTDPNNPNGNYVIVDHDDDGDVNTGFQSWYVHLKDGASPVYEGLHIEQGQRLGWMGSTGRDANGNPTSTGDHLHFAVKYKNSSPAGSELSYVTLDSLLLRSYQTECSGGTYARYYHSSNRIAGDKEQPPAITGVSPSSPVGSNTAQPFTVSGSNFTTGANVTLRDITTGISYPNQTTSAFSANSITINPVFGAVAHSWSVQVTNPNAQASNVSTFQVRAPAVAPAITGVSPSSPAGSNTAQPFTVSGSNFTTGANVTLRDITTGMSYPNQTTSAFSANSITINPVFGAVAHSWSVQVTNPNAQASNVFTFQVRAPAVAPAITGVSPSSPVGSNTAQTFTISGSNFITGANVTLRDITTGISYPNRAASAFSANSITINPVFGAVAHSWSVQVTNPNAQASNVFTFQVRASAAAPAITGVSPSSPVGSNTAQTLTVSGSNFTTGANITLRDITTGISYPNRATRAFTATSITINPVFGAVAHSWSVQVTNPNAQASNVFTFQVRAPAVAPAITGVSPSSPVGSNTAQTFTISGSNFITGANVTLRDITTGISYPNRAASAFSANSITINPVFGAVAHSWSVQVTNPNAQASNVFTFQVRAPAAAPAITGVSPSSPVGSNTAQTLTVSGSNFTTGANITLRDITTGISYPNRATRAFTATSITINPVFGAVAHSWSVQVTNPNAQASNVFTFQVRKP